MPEEEPEISVRRFVFKIFLYIPLLFFFWYKLAGVLSIPAIYLSELILSFSLSGVVEGLEQQGYMVDIVTSLQVAMDSGQEGLLSFPLNTIKYSYGMPLVISMILATPESIYRKLDNITYAMIIITFVQAWGICFEGVSNLVFKTGNEVTNQIINALPYTEHPVFLNVIALGYQLGFLILPAVVPIALWVMTHKSFLHQLSTTK